LVLHPSKKEASFVSARRIALVHDWLTGMRGGEKVLEVLCEIFPRADVYTLVHLPGHVSPAIESHRIYTSPLQNVPGIGAVYRHLLPFMPWAIERFDFSGYDLLISTSHCVAKAAIPAEGAKHVCYCHTPMRYIWDQYDAYFGPGRASWLVRQAMVRLRPRLQRWDVATVPRVHQFIANSENVRARIRRIYQRDASVIYPPVDVEFYCRGVSARQPDRESFYLIVSALAPYKRVDIAIEAFRRMNRKLVVIGEGQERRRLKESAGSGIEFLGWLNQAELRSYYQRCRGLLFPGEEDFGIIPLEAMAAGCPVIAYRRGGALETVVENKTGIFFYAQTPQAIREAVKRFETLSFHPADVSAHAGRFNRQHCAAAFRSYFLEYASEMS
jgi:glycosyltransferase involved in cell wall biosynthesis